MALGATPQKALKGHRFAAAKSSDEVDPDAQKHCDAAKTALNNYMDTNKKMCYVRDYKDPMDTKCVKESWGVKTPPKTCLGSCQTYITAVWEKCNSLYDVKKLDDEKEALESCHCKTKPVVGFTKSAAPSSKAVSTAATAFALAAAAAVVVVL